MTNVMMINNEMMSDAELNLVAGGTHAENEELLGTIVNFNPKLAEEISKKCAGYIDSGCQYETSLARSVGDALFTHYGIDSWCDLVDKNQYTYGYGGKEITHQEVLNIIKGAGDFIIV